MSNKPKVRLADEEFIRNHQDMSERQLAAELKLSKTTVHRVRKRLGLTDACAPPKDTSPTEQTADQNDASRLVLLERHAKRLEVAMANAPVAALAGISKEYRETLKAIEEEKPPIDKPEAKDTEEKKVNAFYALRRGRPPTRAAAQN